MRFSSHVGDFFLARYTGRTHPRKSPKCSSHFTLVSHPVHRVFSPGLLFHPSTSTPTSTTMRQKRAKSYKKQMNLYLHAFKFREPFQTIVDDELVLTCDKASYDLVKGLNRTIQGETKPMITQCCMEALYTTKNQRAIDMAKRFERRRCNHFKDPKPPVECIQSVVNIDGVNKHRYIVASQSMKLRRKLRGVPGVPLIFMNRSVMVMEPASDASQRAAVMHENAKLTAGLNHSKVGYIDKEETEEKKQPEESKTKKRKGPAEPNPLSVKKKKAAPTPVVQEPKKKRSRRHTKSSNKIDASNADETKTIEGEGEVAEVAPATEASVEEKILEEPAGLSD